MLTCSNCGRESPEDFAFCPACSTPLAPAALAREVRKTVSIVFCDVTGSTALGEQLDPESMRDVQSRYFDTMRAPIERHGGTVEKYIGDAVMAVFGIPVLHEDDALRAARAAADMRDALSALNKELERDRGVTIQVRIGINTGEVVAGDPGRGKAFVTGDAVNVAARLEQHAQPGQVLMGETTYRLLHEAVDAESVEPLEMKGKAERVPAWSLSSVREVTSAVPRRLDSPMVGRERPLAQLRQAFDAARSDEACQLFTLLGSAGVGKSRLVEEFLATVGEEAEVLRGRCLPYGEGITYFPVLEAIKQAAGLADFDLPDVVESKVCSVLEGDEHQELVCRHVSQLMGVDEAAAGEETFWAIRRFFEASAGERPLVLVFDDVHWGEPTFLDLVEHIADWSRGSSILLLCMARSDLLDLRPSWGGGKLNAATVSLEPLTDDQATDLIANLLGATELPLGIAERIVQTAEGNPLFVEEMLAMLVDDGLIVRDGERWTATGDLSSVTVPPSIHALLDSRLDRLSPDEREVLEAAAVVGKEFFVGAVSDLVPPNRRALVPSDLLSLVRKDLIRSERTTLPGEDAFRFRHLLVRDSAYEAIPKAQRAELHERFADWLERVAGAAVSEQEEILAYHLEQAHAYRLQLGPADERSNAVGARAAERLASAGWRASARGDHRAATNLFRRAVDLVPHDGARRARLLYELGESTGWVGDTNEAFAAYDEAIGLAADADDRSLEWLARIRRSATQMLTDPHGKPTEQFRVELEEARSAFEEEGDDAALATVWTELANIEWMPCRYVRATLAAERAIEHARRSGDVRLLANAIIPLLAAQMFGVATPDEGLRTLDRVSEDMSESRLSETIVLSIRACFTAMQGSFEEARRLMALADDVAQSIGSEFFLSAHAEQLGHIELYAGNAEAAERAFRFNYESLLGMGDEGHGSTGAAMLGRALWGLGRFEEAERYVEIALRTGAEDDLATQAPARSTQGLLHATRGDLDVAEQLSREAVELMADAECPNFQGDAWMDLAHVLLMAGKPVEAGQAAGEALAFYERKGNRPASGTVRAFIEGLGPSAP